MFNVVVSVLSYQFFHYLTLSVFAHVSVQQRVGEHGGGPAR